MRGCHHKEYIVVLVQVCDALFQFSLSFLNTSNVNPSMSRQLVWVIVSVCFVRQEANACESIICVFQRVLFHGSKKKEAAVFSFSMEAFLTDVLTNPSYLLELCYEDSVAATQSASSSSMVVKGAWTTEEEDLLRQVVATKGSKRWTMIAESIPGRNGKQVRPHLFCCDILRHFTDSLLPFVHAQCRERWHNHLDPTICKSDWTQEEDDTISCHEKKNIRWLTDTRKYDNTAVERNSTSF